MKAAVAVAGVVLAGAVGAAMAMNADLITPLVPQDAGDDTEDVSDPEPPEEDDDTEDVSDLMEPLVPTGTDHAEAYRLDIEYTASVVLDGLAGARGDYFVTYGGDMVHAGEGIYEGKLLARSTGSYTFTLSGCTSNWTGEQVVEVNGEVISSTDPDWDNFIQTPDHDSFYVVLRLRPVGSPRYSDPVDCSMDDDPLPFSLDGLVEQGYPVLAVRLPPPGYGKLIERVSEDIELGEYEWIVEIEPIPRAEASPDVEEF